MMDHLGQQTASTHDAHTLSRMVKRVPTLPSSTGQIAQRSTNISQIRTVVYPRKEVEGQEECGQQDFRWKLLIEAVAEQAQQVVPSHKHSRSWTGDDQHLRLQQCVSALL